VVPAFANFWIIELNNMSLPWDQPNIQPNLTTLSRLRRGDHLSVLKEGENTDGDYSVGNRGLRALFKIQGKFKQSILRSKKGESILEDDQYLRPLTRFFQAAVAEWGRHQVTGDLVSSAFRGLEALRQTYASDQARAAKMDQIITAVLRELPGIRVEGVFFIPGDHEVIMGEQNFPGIRQRILEIITAGNDAMVTEEYKDGVTKEFLDAIYGVNPKAQKATTMPLGNFSYVRKHSGVCRQFYRDAHQGTSTTLNGVRTSCSREDLRTLFEFVDRDDGLLYATSQIATQAGVAGAATILFAQGGRDGRTNVPLIRSGGDRVMFGIGGGGCNITRHQGQILISCEIEVRGDMMGFSVDPRTGPSPPQALSLYGINHIGILISAVVRRAGNRIAVELREATLRITTV
jgi:hypothetical protein